MPLLTAWEIRPGPGCLTGDYEKERERDESMGVVKASSVNVLPPHVGTPGDSHAFLS